MTDNEINIAIAEVCGWKLNPVIGWWHPSVIGNVGKLPDYCNDLNAMHDAEIAFPISDCDMVFNLSRIVGADMSERSYSDIALMVISTARQRAEAFLKTVGKWRD